MNQRLVVVVTYNSDSHLYSTLDALRDEDVLVVDNGSVDNTIEIVRSFANVSLEERRGNRGFAYAVNVGIRHAGPTRDVVLVNPDVRIGHRSLDRLAEESKKPTVGVVAPVLVYPSGELQSAGRRFPNPVRLLARQFGQAEGPAVDDNLVSFPDWAMGAVMYIPARTVAAVGLWDEGFRLYCEDVDYCTRCWLKGLSVVVLQSVKVTHEYGRASSSLWRLDREPVRWHWRSMARLARKYPHLFFTSRRVGP